jgi:hypothetical protein
LVGKSLYNEKDAIMATAQDLVAAIRAICEQVQDASSPCEVAEIQLVQADPPKWQRMNMPLPDSAVILPPRIAFTQNDVGHLFVFIRTNGGQRFYFLYERT